LAQMNHSELSHMAGAVDDSTINIVVVIILLLLLSTSILPSGSSCTSPIWFRRQHCAHSAVFATFRVVIGILANAVFADFSVS